MKTAINPELVTYDSVLAAIAGFDEGNTPTRDSHIPIEGCYHAFSQLAKEFPDEFPDLVFFNRSGVPYSQELEDILFQLGAWRQIQDNNPDYKYFTVTIDKKKLIREEYSDFYCIDTKTAKSFEKIAKRFKELLQER